MFFFFSTSIVPSQVRSHSDSLLSTLKSVLCPLPLEPQLWYRGTNTINSWGDGWDSLQPLSLSQFASVSKNHDTSLESCFLLPVKRQLALLLFCSGRKAALSLFSAGSRYTIDIPWNLVSRTRCKLQCGGQYSVLIVFQSGYQSKNL